MGEELCRLFPVDENIDLISILRNMKRNKPRSSVATAREDRDHRPHHRSRPAGNGPARRSSPDSMRLAQCSLPTWHELSHFGLLPKKFDLSATGGWIRSCWNQDVCRNRNAFVLISMMLMKWWYLSNSLGDKESYFIWWWSRYCLTTSTTDNVV